VLLGVGEMGGRFKTGISRTEILKFGTINTDAVL